MPKQSKLLLTGLVWVAAFFRLPALFLNHFHADEALFSSWARLIAVWRDPLLASQLVDKPPLLFYLQAIFYPLMGPEEWASRLPSLAASILLVPLAAILGWRLYHDPLVSVLIAIFTALSPVAIQFGPTAFTDPMLVSLLVLALLLAAGDSKPGLSGLVFGLAVATKYQAWLFLPLIVGFGWVNRWRVSQWIRWLLGFVPLLVGLSIWDLLRSGSPGIWSNQMSNYGGLRIINSWELIPRLDFWTHHWQQLFGSPFMIFLFAAALITMLFNGITKHGKKSQVDLLLILFIVGYMAIHWLLAVPAWDRYLLPIQPLSALLLARALVIVLDWIPGLLNLSDQKEKRIYQWKPASVILAIIVLFLLPAAGEARAGGEQSVADQGAWQIAGLLADEPYGTVLYDHWYSWHWDYHFFDKGVYVSWFPHPSALEEDLGAFGDQTGSRYIVLTDDAVSRPIQRAINDAGFQLEELFHTDYDPGMILYRVKRGE